MEIVNAVCWNKNIAIISQNNTNLFMELNSLKWNCFSPVLFEEEKFVQTTLDSINRIGLLADVLSGSYGKDYFSKYFFFKYGKQVNTVERFSFIGKDGIGAIEFEPSSFKEVGKKSIVMSLKEFKERSIAVYNGDSNDDVSFYIARSNSGAGGAKAKGIAVYNTKTKQVILNSATSIKENHINCIIKFNTKKGEDAQRYNDELKLEYIYYLIALESGLKMSNCYLEEDDEGNCYFITERFDIDDNGNKQHIHSLAGILSHDASSFTLGYEMLFKVGRRLVVPMSDYKYMFRNMLLNIVFANRDDHSRNFSFIMNSDCEWCYAPSYDLTYSGSDSDLMNNQLTINGSFANKVKYMGIKKIADIANIKEPIKMIKEIIDIKHAKLRLLCSQYNVSSTVVETIFSDTADIDKRFS